MTIALDAMGGDLAPAATVEGALRAHRERGLDVVLVGDEPRVRIGANGEEEGKGTDLTRAAAAALRKPESGVTFRGYVEGKDVFAGEFDVIATDGFTGNVLLKTAEGAVWAFGQLLKRQIQASAVASAGALLLRSQLDQVRNSVDYEKV